MEDDKRQAMMLAAMEEGLKATRTAAPFFFTTNADPLLCCINQHSDKTRVCRLDNATGLLNQTDHSAVLTVIFADTPKRVIVDSNVSPDGDCGAHVVHLMLLLELLFHQDPHTPGRLDELIAVVRADLCGKPVSRGMRRDVVVRAVRTVVTEQVRRLIYSCYQDSPKRVPESDPEDVRVRRITQWVNSELLFKDVMRNEYVCLGGAMKRAVWNRSPNGKEHT